MQFENATFVKQVIRTCRHLDPGKSSSNVKIVRFVFLSLNQKQTFLSMFESQFPLNTILKISMHV